MALTLVWRFVRWLLLGGVVVVLATALQIYSYSSNIDKEKADAVIVLGASVWHDQPSPVFQARIDHAIKLYKEKQIEWLVFTGGIGQGKQYAEAVVAQQYAVQRGIPIEAVLLEQVSRTTLQNLKYTQALLMKRNLKRVLIVSDPLHMKRAVTIANDLGLDAYPSPTQTSRYQSLKSQLQFLSRETYFYWHYQLGLGV